MAERFIRFVVAERDMRSDQPRGIFSALYDLEKSGKLADYELDWFVTVEKWFDSHLERPTRFAWSKRPNAPRRAVTWLKMSATEHVSRMRELVSILNHKDIVVEELRSENPGYVVYEDAYQIAVIPFGGKVAL